MSVQVENAMLDDLLEQSLDVVFCGTGAGTKSAREKAYYAHGGNQFWKILNEAGFTPHKIKPSEFRELLKYKVGLTDLVKEHAGMDRKIPAAAWPPARERLTKIIETYQPRFIGFTSLNAAKNFFNETRTLGPQPETIGSTKLWVLPSTSSAARQFWNASVWLDFGREVKQSASA